MHILIGIITAIAGLLWALHSLQNSGVNLNAFNPFFWYRRHQWSKLYGQKPLYGLDKPMDVAAALVLGSAKLGGELSKEHKQLVLDIFQSEFKLSSGQAQELFASSSFLLQSDDNYANNVDKILARTKDQFNEAQIASTLNLVERVANVEGSATVAQQQFIAQIAAAFAKPASTPGSKW
jgi:hypothetical protein